jgi:hypothetical protein
MESIDFLEEMIEFMHEHMKGFEPEEINFLETQKIQNALKFVHNNKDANQRGCKLRWAEKAEMNIDDWWYGRWLKYKKNGPPQIDLDDGNDVFISSEFEAGNKLNGKCGSPFLCDGMTVVISEDGTTGAVCFNSNYFGKKIIKE